MWAGETSYLDFYLLFTLETTVTCLAGTQKGLILGREREREEKGPHSFIQIRKKGVFIVYPLLQKIRFVLSLKRKLFSETTN